VSAAHTEGPWYPIAGRVRAERSHGVVANLSTDAAASNDQFQANARLIAAAPDLLEACKRALDFIHTLPYEPSNAPSTRVQDALIDAIAKAEGSAS